MRLFINLLVILVLAIKTDAQSSNRLMQIPNTYRITICVSNPPDLSKMTFMEAKQAIETAQESIYYKHAQIGPEYVSNLVNELRYGGLDNDKKLMAIWLLARLHPLDSNSLGAIIEYVDLLNTNGNLGGTAPRWGPHPAEDALILIAKPSVDPILYDLPNETNAFRVHLLCEALVLIEGFDRPHFDRAKGKAAAQSQIQQMLAAEKDSAKRANLAAALKELEK